MHQPLGPPNQKMRMAMWWKVSAPLRQRKVLSKAHGTGMVGFFCGKCTTLNR